MLLALPLWSGMVVAGTTGEVIVPHPQQRPWAPAAPAQQEPIWPDGLAIAAPINPAPEVFGTNDPKIGQPITVVGHVARPTMTIFPPKGANTGAAVVVFPGGGYRILAIDLEGTEICDMFTAKGVTCVLLKYRVPGSGPYWSEECQCRGQPTAPMALQDAQRTISLVRQRADKLGIDPHKIGVIGFSAGGHMVAEVSNHPQRSYRPVDAADQQSSRPDFAMALYPGHLWKEPGLGLSLKIARDCPPTFIAQAEDDPVDDVRESLSYFLALKQADIPTEMHLYAKGGHAFGVRPGPNPITQWPALADAWMRTIGVLPAAH